MFVSVAGVIFCKNFLTPVITYGMIVPCGPVTTIIITLLRTEDV